MINVLDYGAVGDGVHDDTSALQAAFDACVPGHYGFPGSKVYAPAGYAFRITNTVELHRPATVEINSPIVYDAPTGSALVFGSTGWQQYYDIKLAGVLHQNGNPTTPSGVGSANGVEIKNMVFSYIKIGSIQGFSGVGLLLNGSGDNFNYQVIQHNSFELGQVCNNGIGIHMRSQQADTSSTQANYLHIQNCYQNFFGFVLDDAATDSNYLLFDALDNANQTGGGQGGVVHGKWNHIELSYLGCNIWFGPTSESNTLDIYNSHATDASWTAGGVNNRYNIAP